MNDQAGLLDNMSTSFLVFFLSLSIFLFFLLLSHDTALFLSLYRHVVIKKKRDRQRYLMIMNEERKKMVKCCYNCQSTKLSVKKNYSFFSMEKEALKDVFCSLINHVYIEEWEVGIVYNNRCIMNRTDRQ
jgi:hypothetical protein